MLLSLKKHRQLGRKIMHQKCKEGVDELPVTFSQLPRVPGGSVWGHSLLNLINCLLKGTGNFPNGSSPAQCRSKVPREHSVCRASAHASFLCK